MNTGPVTNAEQSIELRVPKGINSISIVLPAHNEEENITEAALQAVNIINQLPFDDYELVVIDDGSSDRTGDLVNILQDNNHHIRLIKHASNLGYGASLKSGLLAAQCDIVFFTDADLQFNLNELPAFIEELDKNDIVIGYRKKRPEHIIRRLNAFGWRLLIRALFGLRVRDIDCAFKLFRRNVLQSISIDSIGAFINSEILIRARGSSFKIKELPVTHFPRKAGNPSGAKPKTIFRAFKELIKLYGQLKRKSTYPDQNRAYSS